MTGQHDLVVGRVVRPHALHGEVVVRETMLSAEEFSALKEIELVDPSGKSLGPHTIKSARQFGKDLLVFLSQNATSSKIHNNNGVPLS